MPQWVMTVFAVLAGVAVVAGVTLSLVLDDGGKPTTTSQSAASGSTGASGASGPGNAIEEDPRDCDVKGINRAEGKEGSCFTEGVKFTVVDKDSTLELEQLAADLVQIETLESVEGGLGTGSATADGTFVIIELAVTNRTSSPKYFDEFQEQVGLSLGRNTYTQDFDAENGPVRDSFLWQAEEIQPEATQNGTVVFDVPDKNLGRLERDGNIYVVNFSDADQRNADRIGIIRTYM